MWERLFRFLLQNVEISSIRLVKNWNPSVLLPRIQNCIFSKNKIFSFSSGVFLCTLWAMQSLASLFVYWNIQQDLCTRTCRCLSSRCGYCQERRIDTWCPMTLEKWNYKTVSESTLKFTASRAVTAIFSTNLALMAMVDVRLISVWCELRISITMLKDHKILYRTAVFW